MKAAAASGHSLHCEGGLPESGKAVYKVLQMDRESPEGALV